MPVNVCMAEVVSPLMALIFQNEKKHENSPKSQKLTHCKPTPPKTL
jgi:hypothetical protein